MPIGSPPEVTQASADPRDLGLSAVEDKFREKFAEWNERLDDDASDDVIERAMRDFGVAIYRARHQARWREITGAVMREILERFAEYIGGVKKSPGAYLASMIEDARAAIRAQLSAERSAQLEGRAAEAATIQDRVDDLSDTDFVELAVRCELWPDVDRPTRNGEPLRTFNTVYVQAVQKAFRYPELLDGLGVAI